MNYAMALQGLLPLIVFAVVDMFANMRVAIISAIIFSVLEAVWGWYSYGEVDQTTWISLGLILAMGAVSIRMKSDKLFKFQPVAMGAVFAVTLGYFQLRGNPLMVQMMPKVAPLLPPENREQLMDPRMIALMARLDRSLIVVFMAHGSLVGWAAMKKSTMYWLIIRGVGFYVLLGLDLIVNMALGPT